MVSKGCWDVNRAMPVQISCKGCWDLNGAMPMQSSCLTDGQRAHRNQEAEFQDQEWKFFLELLAIPVYPQSRMCPRMAPEH